MKRITDEKIRDAIDTADCNAEVYFMDSKGGYRLLGWAKSLLDTVTQAQLDSCEEEAEKIHKQELQEMIEEIEKQAILAPEGDIIEISLDNEWWQDFKERWLND